MKYQHPPGEALDASYRDGNERTGEVGSVVPAAAIEHPMREIVNVIEGLGLLPKPLRPGIKGSYQLLTALRTLVPPGLIAIWSSANIPSGWLFCNGRSFKRKTYPDLFNAIGTVYGSEDENSFNLPNLTTRFPRGSSIGEVGLSGGRETAYMTTSSQAWTHSSTHKHAVQVHPHKLTMNEMPPHAHADGDFKQILQNSDGKSLDSFYSGGGLDSKRPKLTESRSLLTEGGGQAHTHGGSSTSHTETLSQPSHFHFVRDVMPPYLRVYFIIRT